MLIKEIMNTDVAECTEDTPLADVYDLIQHGPKNYVVVIDSPQHRVPIGVVNEHTICESLVRQTRTTKVQYASNVMSSNIKRVCENDRVDNCRHLIETDANAIVVVNERRQFRGVVESADIRSALRQNEAVRQRGPIFASVLGQAIPASVEIPAFGWLK